MSKRQFEKPVDGILKSSRVGKAHFCGDDFAGKSWQKSPFGFARIVGFKNILSVENSGLLWMRNPRCRHGDSHFGESISRRSENLADSVLKSSWAGKIHFCRSNFTGKNQQKLPHAQNPIFQTPEKALSIPRARPAPHFPIILQEE